MHRIRNSWLTAMVLVVAVFWAFPAFGQPRNIFIMISDGASFGAWDMTDLYTQGRTASSIYFGPEFRKFLMTTFPLNTSTFPTGGQVPQVSYDPHQAWNTTPDNGEEEGYPYFFKAYRYLRQNYTDSAAAVTAMACGQKTYRHAINWSNEPAGGGSPLTPNIPELAKQHGQAVGTITSVPWCHATPAGFSNAHNISRRNYQAIANAMLAGQVMDVIMGAGHPQYDHNGRLVIASYNDPAITDQRAKYMGGRATWIALHEGTHPQGWKLIESKAEFEVIAEGGSGPFPPRLLGVAQVAETLQQKRDGYDLTDKVDDDPPIPHVPTLLTMTKAAVHLLQTKSRASGNKGFFLHIEGGAVDWAAHANQTSRLIEEQRDFNHCVRWVVSWIEKNGGWADNLLIITTDHGNGLPMGANSGVIPFQRLQPADVSGIPRVKWHSNKHTNELVPLFARGAGAEVFDSLVEGTDPYFARFYPDWGKTGFDGRYVDNTAVYKVLAAALAPGQKTQQRALGWQEGRPLSHTCR